MPTLEEVHLGGLGAGEVAFDLWPDLAEWLAYYNHLIFKRSGRPVGAVVILDRTAVANGIVITGLGLGWWLSVDNDGSIVEDREYIAGNDQLDNGGFETLDALGFPLRWNRAGENSLWVLDSVNHESGTYAMRVSGPTRGKDDVLVSTQPREIRPGALVRAWASAFRPAIYADTGRRLRLRTAYQGRFDQPDLLGALDFDVDWTNDSETPGDAVSIDSNTLQMGPVTQIQWIINGGFETGDFTNWVGDTALDPDDGSIHWAVSNSLTVDLVTILPRTGSNMALANYSGTSAWTQRWLGTSTGPGVNPGDRWRLQGFACEGSATSGEAYLVLEAIKDGLADNKPSNALNGNRYADPSGSGSPFGYTWKLLAVDYDVPDDVTGILPWLYVGFDVGTPGSFLFDDITLTRTKGNTAKYTAPAVSVTPEKSYKLSAAVTGSWPGSGASRNGTLHYSILLEGAGRTDQLIVSSDLDVSQAATQMVLEHTFTPPSGYDNVTVTIVATDLAGGNVLIAKPTLRCEDTSEYVVDRIIGPTGVAYAQYTQDSEAPEGAESLVIKVVAEDAFTEDDVWVVDEVNWHRRETPTSTADIIDDFLRHNDTGEYLVAPGNIDADGVPLADWRLVNVPNGAGLLDLLANRVSPALEYKHRPDNTIDIGTADQLSVVRDLILTQEKLLVLDEPKAKSSVEDRLTDATVLGARLQRPAPLPDAVISATYEADSPGVDWFGNPVRRRRIVVDQAVDYQAGAALRAQSEVERSIATVDAITFGLAEWISYEDFDVGDWLGVYKPEALWEDRSNPQTDEHTGARIFPRLSRVLDRKITKMARGDGWSIWVRLADGTERDVSRFVQWDDATAATVTLGDQRANFANDPQGPGAGVKAVQDTARTAR